MKTCAFLVFAIAAYGADFAGIWTGHAPDRNGDLQDFSFRFEQRDGVLSGKMYGDNESVPIAEAQVSGNEITFVVITELNGSITKTLFTGTLKDGEIQVVRARVGAVPDKPNPKQTFVLKRLG